jgi:hypothetical protein
MSLDAALKEAERLAGETHRVAYVIYAGKKNGYWVYAVSQAEDIDACDIAVTVG